jgi:hypothetical protein
MKPTVEPGEGQEVGVGLLLPDETLDVPPLLAFSQLLVSLKPLLSIG